MSSGNAPRQDDQNQNVDDARQANAIPGNWESSTFSDSGSPPSRPKARHRLGYRLLIGLGILSILATAAWWTNATLWTRHSNTVGHQLIQEIKVKARNASDSSARCTVSRSGPQGLLEAPAIGLVAPVEQGTNNSVLSVAVGHDPYSVWPGSAGNAVLEAHDVSYFVHIDRLHPKDVLQYVTPCATYEFSVNGHQILKEGTTVYNTNAPTLTLVTCWPTDALWFTPDRYLVTATETAVIRRRPRSLKVPAVGPAIEPTVAAPPALVSQGLTLQTYLVPMGTMTIVGSPLARFVESPGPLLDQDAAVEAFIAGVRATTENRISWWRDIAPGVPVPSALVGAGNPSYLTALDVTVTASGSHVSSIELTTTVSIQDGPAPGRYAMTVHEAISHSKLYITSWTLRSE